MTRPLSIDTLCNMWIENDLPSLWNLARLRAVSRNEGKGGASGNLHTKVIKQAVSLGRSGMMGKACRVLQSNGIAPDNETTWDLLKAKHPSGPVPLVQATLSTSVTLEQDYLFCTPSLRTRSQGLQVCECNTCLMLLASHFPHLFAPYFCRW